MVKGAGRADAVGVGVGKQREVLLCPVPGGCADAVCRSLAPREPRESAPSGRGFCRGRGFCVR